VKLSGGVVLHAAVCLKPPAQCIKKRGQFEWSHADEGRKEVGGNNCDQGIHDWGASLNVQGPGEAGRREASCGRVFIEGGEDIECNMDCGGVAQEEGNVEDEGFREDGVGALEEGFAVQQPNTYEAERNKRVAKVQERLQILLSAKTSMWVGSFCGFLLWLSSGCCPYPVHSNCEHGMWSVDGRPHSHTRPFVSKP
jgi:hypothetical protein